MTIVPLFEQCMPLCCVSVAGVTLPNQCATRCHFEAGYIAGDTLRSLSAYGGLTVRGTVLLISCSVLPCLCVRLYVLHGGL